MRADFQILFPFTTPHSLPVDATSASGCGRGRGPTCASPRQKGTRPMASAASSMYCIVHTYIVLYVDRYAKGVKSGDKLQPVVSGGLGFLASLWLGLTDGI